MPVAGDVVPTLPDGAQRLPLQGALVGLVLWRQNGFLNPDDRHDPSSEPKHRWVRMRLPWPSRQPKRCIC